MRSCQDFILRAMLDLTAAGRTPLRAGDLYGLVREWDGPCKELTVRAYVYAGRLELADGTVIYTTRVARGQFLLSCPDAALRALAGVAPEWQPLLGPVLGLTCPLSGTSRQKAIVTSRVAT